VRARHREGTNLRISAPPSLSLPSLCVLCVLGGESFCFAVADGRGLFNTVITDRYSSGWRNSLLCLRAPATLVEMIPAALTP